MGVGGSVIEDSKVRTEDRGDVSVTAVMVTVAVVVTDGLSDGDGGDIWAVSNRRRWLRVRGSSL